MKRVKKISVVLFVLSVFFIGLVTAVSAATKAELKQQKKEAEQKEAEAQYKVDQTQNTIDGILKEIDAANAQIKKIDTEINSLDREIDAANAELAATEKELNKIEKQFNKQKKEAEQRICVAYMFSNDYYEVIFSSKSFGDLIENLYNIAAVSKADTQIMQDLKATQKKIEEKKSEIEESKKKTEEAKAEQVKKREAQADIKSQKDQLYADNKDLLDQYKAEKEEQNAIKEAADAELARIAVQELEQQKREQEKKASQESGKSSSGGSSGSSSSDKASSSSGYIWPTTSYVITDYFGYRESPGGIGSTNHMGLDIGAGYGEPIYAVASGKVVLAEWNGGYGNCVEIAHSSGYITLYGHMSQISCSYGQYVSQGQVIGYIGSTGNSTGPHLHISFIDAYGNFVDPLNFLQ